MVPDSNPTIPAATPPSDPPEGAAKTNPLAVAIPPASPVPKEMALTGEPTPDSQSYSDWALSQILSTARRIESFQDDLLKEDGNFAKVMSRHNADAALKLAAAAQKFEKSVEGLTDRVAKVETAQAQVNTSVEGLQEKLRLLEIKWEKEREEMWAEIRKLQAKENK